MRAPAQLTTILLVTAVAAIVDAVAHPVVLMQTAIILAHKASGRTQVADSAAAILLVGAVRTVPLAIADQFQRNALVVDAALVLIGGAHDFHMLRHICMAVLLVIVQGAVEVAIAQKAGRNALLAVPASMELWCVAACGRKPIAKKRAMIRSMGIRVILRHMCFGADTILK